MANETPVTEAMIEAGEALIPWSPGTETRRGWPTVEQIYRAMHSASPTDSSTIAGLRAEIERLREALDDLQQRATKTLGAVDRYNEKNGTYIVGPSLLQLGKSIARARTALNGGSHDPA